MDGPLVGDGILRRILGAAGAAPSIHNTQPWRFRVCGDVIELHGDPERMLWIADPMGRALHLSCGAALFNLRLAVRMIGARPLVWPRPDPEGEPTLLASVQVAQGRPPSSHERETFEAIQQRHTSRGPYSDQPVPDSVQIALEQEAGFEFAVLRVLSARDAATVIGIAADADKKLAADFDHRVELAGWVASTGDDGIPAAALSARPDTEPAPVRDFGYAAPAAPRLAGTYESLPQLAVLSTARDEPADWLRAGQALQRVLLAATRNGVATSLLYQPLELRDMRRSADGWWPWPECPQIVIRFGYGPIGPPTPRRQVTDLLARPADTPDYTSASRA